MFPLDKFTYFTQFFFRSIIFLAAVSLGRFLGSEGTALMTTGKSLVLFGTVICLLIALFRRVRCQIKYGFLNSIYFSLLFLIFMYGSLIRCYLLSNLGIYFETLLPCFILYVSDPGLSTSNGDTSSSTTHIVSSDSPHSPIIPPNPQPGGNLLSLFGTQDPDRELELYARIRLLENLLIERLPPQLNLGEYENLVRDNLNQARNVLHYQSALSHELFDITVLELKANLQDRLFNLLMAEPDERLQLILRESPFPERAIRSEALEFIEGRLDLLNLGNPHPHAYPEKVILQTTLEQWLTNLREFDQNSAVYAEFLSHFRGV